MTIQINNIPKFITGRKRDIVNSDAATHTIAQTTDTNELLIKTSADTWLRYTTSTDPGCIHRVGRATIGGSIDVPYPVVDHIDISSDQLLNEQGAPGTNDITRVINSTGKEYHVVPAVGASNYPGFHPGVRDHDTLGGAGGLFLSGSTKLTGRIKQPGGRLLHEDYIRGDYTVFQVAQKLSQRNWSEYDRSTTTSPPTVPITIDIKNTPNGYDSRLSGLSKADLLLLIDSGAHGGSTTGSTVPHGNNFHYGLQERSNDFYGIGGTSLRFGYANETPIASSRNPGNTYNPETWHPPSFYNTPGMFKYVSCARVRNNYGLYRESWSSRGIFSGNFGHRSTGFDVMMCGANATASYSSGGAGGYYGRNIQNELDLFSGSELTYYGLEINGSYRASTPMYISEYIVIAGWCSDELVQQIGSYLANKWNLSDQWANN